MAPVIRLREATTEDIVHLERWDLDPDVIAATSNDPDAPKAFGDTYWPDEFALRLPGIYEYWIAEVQDGDGWRPFGAMQMIDPHLEPTHYWGEIEPNLRALDIWIGEASDRGAGLGRTMMQMALERCFADPSVTAIIIDPLASNVRAHAFYQRLGFAPTHRQTFNDDEDDCLVHRLTRADWESGVGRAP